MLLNFTLNGFSLKVNFELTLQLLKLQGELNSLGLFTQSIKMFTWLLLTLVKEGIVADILINTYFFLLIFRRYKTQISTFKNIEFSFSSYPIMLGKFSLNLIF